MTEPPLPGRSGGMAETPTPKRPSPEEAQVILRVLVPEDRHERRRAFIAALARMNEERS